MLKDSSIAGFYKDEMFSLNEDELLYGAEKKKITFKDVKDTKAKTIYTTGKNWHEKIW